MREAFLKKTFPVLGAFMLGVLLTVQPASATPLATVTYGGHTYDLYGAPGEGGLISWTDANDAATLLGGYLAVLTDLAEIQAVYDGLIGHDFFSVDNTNETARQAWVGASPGTPGTTDATDWKWVSNEDWTPDDVSNFSDFPDQEPNGDNEGGGLTMNRYQNYKWNDVTAAGGYIVESVSVPDGGTTIALLGIALTGLGLLRRRA